MQPATLVWFARHEIRIAWREWQALMTAGNRRHIATALIALAVFAAIMHLPAYALVAAFIDQGIATDKRSFIVITAMLLLYGMLVLSQAMESATRAFYARADLDLILSAPVSSRLVFSVRIGAIGLTMVGMAVLMASPLIDVLAWRAGPQWLAGYGVVAAIGATATAVAIALTVALFRTLGPRRTRLAAQIVAAIVGAAFVIGLQAMAIFYYGTFARPSFLVSAEVLGLAPGVDSPAWWPARAVMGDPAALAAVLTVGLGLLVAAMATFSARFGHHAVAAAGSAGRVTTKPWRARGFRAGGPARVLRRKEWTLLRRDPWLVSQTLTQLLYLLPPALLLSRNFGGGTSTLTVIVFAVVTVSGQLAGGLAWLAISGEDAPDLVMTAPVSPRALLRAKVEAVMGAILIVFAPLLLIFTLVAPLDAVAAALGIAVAALSSVRIQLWFRSQAKRSLFRRRHTSSRIATLAEAFSSFAWAGTTALAASGTWFAIGGAVFAAIVLLAARAVSPRRAALA